MFSLLATMDGIGSPTFFWFLNFVCLLIVFFNRKCEHCPSILKSELGLRRHEANKKDQPCGIWARKTRKNNKMLEHEERLAKIKQLKLKDIEQPTKKPKLENRPRGEPLSKGEKRMIAHMYDTNMEDLNDMRNVQSEVIKP